MALTLLTTTSFEKDLRRAERQGRNLDKLEAIVNLLQSQEDSPAGCRVHRVIGNWSGHWDCHIGPDWVLLNRVTEKELILVRTGSHSELFG